MPVFPLSIPSNQREFLLEIARISEPDAEAIAELFEKATPALSPLELSGQLSGALQQCTSSDSLGLVYTIVSLAVLVHRRSGNVSDVAESIVAELKKSKTPVDGIEQLQSRLVRYLSAEPIQLTAKTFDIAGEHRDALLSVRILSDMRPLFETSDGAMHIRGIVVLHTLKLESAGSEDYYVSMTSAGLRDLKKAVERALEKEDCISRTLEQANINEVRLKKENAS